jgi:hypothetical protein
MGQCVGAETGDGISVMTTRLCWKSRRIWFGKAAQV